MAIICCPVYKLHTVLQGNSMDVKHMCLVKEPSGALLTASREKTGKMWYENNDLNSIIVSTHNVRYMLEDNSYIMKNTYKGHTKYVSCVAYQDPSEEFPTGLVFTGCEDGKVRAFLPDKEDPLFLLEGHGEKITSLFVGR